MFISPRNESLHQSRILDERRVMPSESFIIVSRYLKGDGWQKDEETLTGVTYEQAGRQASKKAKELDVIYGDDHFWTVDLYDGHDPEERIRSSYYQFFHGRTS
jgi:hypothetical protein